MRRWMRFVASLSLFALAAAAQAAPLPCPIGFASPRVYDRGAALRVAVEVADFDNDGLPDIASLHRLGNDGTPDRTGTILLNRGHEAFDPRPLIAPGDFGTLHAGLLNNDAIPDLVLGGSSPLTILYGNGDGTFRNGGTADARNVVSIAFGQFDGKNGVDIAVVQSTPPSLTILLSNANGTFSLSAAYALSDTGVGVATADFDGDGKIDIVAADKNSVIPFFGNGDGTFTRGTTFTNVPPVSVTVGDIDRDGRPDIISGGHQGVGVFLNTGARSFRLNGNFPLFNEAKTVTITDVDHDAFPDLVVTGSGDVVVMRGAAGGGLLPGVYYAAGADPEWGAVGDFDRDGFNDVVVANFGSADIAILKNVGGGNLDAMRTLQGGLGAIDMAVVDANSDNHPDLVVADQLSNDMTIFRGAAGGGFESPPSGIALGFSPKLLRIGDVNGDAYPDFVLLSTDGKTIGIVLGGFGGTLTLAAPLTFGNPLCCIGLADLDHDGKDDLIYADQAGTMSVRLATGNGTFGAPADYSLPQPATAMAVDDFDLDGNKDIAVATDAAILLYYSEAGGSLFFPMTIDVAGTKVLETGLMNGDVFPDIIAGGSDVAVITSDHGASFPMQVHLTVPTGNVTAIAVGDLDLDGANDLAVTNFSPATAENFVSVYINRKDGGFDAPAAIETELEPRAVVAHDFDGDGIPDLVVAAAGKPRLAHGRCATPAVTVALPRVITPGQPVTLIANALAGAVRGAEYTFFVDGKIVAAVAANPLEPGVARANVTIPTGTHTVSVLVHFAEGAAATSDPIPITIGGGKRHSVRH